MMNLVEAILEKHYETANSLLAERFGIVMQKKLLEMKKQTSAKMFAEMDLSSFKPDYASIEDRRTTQVVQDKAKTSLPGTQNTTDELKTDKLPSASKTDLVKEEELAEARIKIVTRVRNGKVQRRVKKSNVSGMTLRGGKLTRMSPAERRKRKMGARRAKVKRKSKMGRILMKRKRSLARRKAMGL